MKVVGKHRVLQTQQQEHLFQEVKYMAKMSHPFLCQLRGVAQDSRNLYMLMDYVQHGELMNVLRAQGRMTTSLARFYIAQVLLVFEYLHGQDLIYRDLKPENVLVKDNGYVKLTDFGFVKRLKAWDRTYTLCGTPEYMAPEIILNVGHGRAADWYTLGIFAYELIVGRPPFMHQDTYEVFKMTLREKIPFVSGFPSDAKSLIKHLTHHDLSKRFGNLVNGSGDVRSHRFFKHLDFAQVATQRMAAPHVPSARAKKDYASLLKDKGLPVNQIPESNDETNAPKIKPDRDLFADWF